MPWQGGTLAGTTETPFRGDPACVAATPAEAEYLLETLRHYFPAYRGRGHQHNGGPAGPVARYSSASRAVARDGTLGGPRCSPHHLAIYGGKLTAYRATAERVMLRVLRVLPGRGPSRTPATSPFDADAQAVDHSVAKV
jgi:glycerol-3-phosphate dehydrogenase